MTPNEAVRHQVREALGGYNNTHEDVITLVRRLREAAEDAGVAEYEVRFGKDDLPNDL